MKFLKKLFYKKAEETPTVDIRTVEKVIVRTKTVPNISGKIVEYGYAAKTLDYICAEKGMDWVLQHIFGEKEHTYEQLLAEYIDFLAGKDSNLFVYMYRLNPFFGVKLDRNIYLYHSSVEYSHSMQTLLGWRYMETSRYIADTWWYTDEEILYDLQHISAFQFVEKYRAYME